MLRGAMVVCCSACILLTLTAAPLRAATLVKDGQPNAVIVVDRKAAGCQWYAAEELVNHIEAMTGAKLPIAKVDMGGSASLQAVKKDGQSVILLGRNKLNQDLHPELDKLGPDGFLVDVQEEIITIAGRDDTVFNLDGAKVPGSAGTLYGVYHVLEELGVRWYWPNEELGTIIPKSPTITLSNRRIAKTPAFPLRLTEGMSDRWFRRIGYGSDRNPWASRHSFRDWGKRFAESHPEYFTVDDQGKPNIYHIGFPHPGVIEQVVEDARAYFKSNQVTGRRRYFGVLANDYFMTMCKCDQCRSRVTPDREEAGLFSDYIGEAVVKVAEQLKQEFPDEQIVYGAYERYLLPPTRMETLPENVSVMLAYKRRSRPVMGTTLPEVEVLKQWQALNPREIYIWRYYMFGTKGYPYWMPHLIDRSVKTMHEVSEPGKPPVLGELQFRRAHPRTVWWMAPTNYITAKLLWNPTANVDELLSEYFNQFYGPASEPMARFHGVLESLYANHGELSLIPEAELEQLAMHLGDAVNAAKEAPYSDRVRFVQDNFLTLSKTLQKNREALTADAAAPREGSLLLSYSFDNAAGDTVQDESGRGSAARIIGARAETGVKGKALAFDGDQAHLKLDKPVVVKDSYTFSAWIKPSKVKSRQVLYGENDDIFAPYTIFGSYAVNHTSDRVSLSIANERLVLHNRGIGTLSSVTLPFSEDGWHHVVGTVDHKNEEMCIYLDGKLVGIETILNSGEPQAMPLILIGATGDLDSRRSEAIRGVRGGFVGLIDEVRVYDYAISASEVVGLYRQHRQAQ